MSNYDFGSLSSYDFEELVRDLLQEELHVTLESFTAGRDAGIDLRCSIDPTRTIIVQCKHYAGSPFRHLLSKLRSEESPKVKKLKPSRYILAISNGLTPANKDKIKSLFEPYCISTGDIHGRDDLNNLLGKLSGIETRHHKLWLTSVAVLQRVLNSNVFANTSGEIQVINRKLKYYVQNTSFSRAKSILEDVHYCIIAGIPGIGKTTLAEILLVEYLMDGYEVIKISENIDEARRVYDPSRKQIFYYDDFLGQSNLENKLAKNEEQNILRFVEEMRYTKNTRFILTTREYILNQAKTTYERLDRSDFDLHKCVIELSDYSREHRAKILFNHVYFSMIPAHHKAALLADRNYLRIIDHQNFNPRVIETMIDFANKGNVSASGYLSTFLANLKNPTRIWEHIFENQLSAASQQLLLVLATVPRQIYYEDLWTAFERLYSNGSSGSERPPHQVFRTALKQLEGNFIRITKADQYILVQFHNASIRDFIDNFLLGNDTELKSLITSAVFFEQCVRLWSLGYHGNLRRPISKYLDDFLDSVVRNLSSPSCSLMSTYDTTADKNYLFRRSINMEDRIGFMLGFGEELRSGKAYDVIRLGLRLLHSAILEGEGDKESLVNIFSRLRKIGFDSESLSDLICATKTVVMGKLLSLEDFVHFVSFRQYFKDFVTDAENESMRRQFKRFYIRDVSAHLSDIRRPTILHDYAKRLRRVAAAFEIDAHRELDKVEGYAKKLDGELQQYTRLALKLAEEAEHDSSTHRSARTNESQEDFSSDDIDALFEDLLDSIPARIAKKIRPTLWSTEDKLLEAIFGDKVYAFKD